MDERRKKMPCELRQTLVRNIWPYHKEIIYMASQTGDNRCWMHWLRLFRCLPEGHECSLPDCDSCQDLCRQYNLCQRLYNTARRPGIRLIEREYDDNLVVPFVKTELRQKPNGDFYFPQYTKADNSYLTLYMHALDALQTNELECEIKWLIPAIRGIRDKGLRNLTLNDHRLIYSRLLIPFDIDLTLPKNQLDNCKSFMCKKHEELRQNPNADIFAPPPGYQAVKAT